MNTPKSQLSISPIKRNLMKETDDEVNNAQPKNDLPVVHPVEKPKEQKPLVPQEIVSEPEKESGLSDPKLQMILDKMIELDSVALELSNKFDQLSNKVETDINGVSQKLVDVRNPNDLSIEDMASLTSYPYTVSVSKYWGQKLANREIDDQAIMNYDQQNLENDIKSKINNMSDADVKKSLNDF